VSKSLTQYCAFITSRKARVILPNPPHPIVQRGHNKRALFVEKADSLYYLANLREWKENLKVLVYGCCLMTNHIHLIVDPRSCPSNINELMKHLAGCQTRYVNKMEHRSSSLWEGRYKISPIQTDEYLLRCCHYVELNPVKAKMCDQAE
jgi:putative transposase